MRDESDSIPNNPEITLAELRVLHRELYRWALSVVHYDREIADDVLQETYVRILNGKAKFSGASSLRTWSFSVIRIVAADYYRARTSAVETLKRYHLSIAATEPRFAPEFCSDLDTNSKRIVSALMNLPDSQRQVIELVFYREMTIEQAAQVMSVSVGTARQHYARGKKRLANILNQKELVNERKTPTQRRKSGVATDRRQRRFG